MGVIKDGAVTGTLPDSDAFFAVHYPGYPSSTARAVESLGGSDAIAKARETNRLELRFRPEDPYSHPAIGELQPCNSLLLRISKKKTNVSPDSGTVDNNPGSTTTDAPESGSVCADIVAKVPQAYHFNGMADYQYVLPVHAATSRRRKRESDETESRFEEGGLMDIDQDDVMMLLPPFFSLKDSPGKLVLNPSMISTSKKIQSGVVKHPWEMSIEPCLALRFDIEAKKVNWEDHIPKGTAHWEWQMALSNLFEERPIWIRRSIHEHLLDDGMEVSTDQLKRLLFRAGYSFSTGPFGRFWIRKGYDPRKDPESRIYQKVDFRIPPSLRHLGHENTTDELKHKWKDLCGFKVFPDKSFTTLQLFELNDDFIQQEIRKPAEQKSCTRATGWLSRPTIDLLRLYVSMKFLSILPGEDAGRMLKSVSQRFESLKSLPSLKDDSRSMEKEHEFEHRGSNSDAAAVQQNELNDDEIQCEAEDEPEHEAEDEDDDEEEVDEYGSLNEEFNFEGGGEDENFSLEAGSYPIGGDISKDYLQELFSFPPLVDGQDYEQNVEDADTSEEEYQIFEQESDSDLPEDGDGDDGFS